MTPNENFYSGKKTLIYSALILLLLICIAYSNHFTNGFEFDDSHTITNNTFIRDIKNIPLFFSDIKYYGTNPGNQGYNPVLVSLNAIDYWLAGGLIPVYFHADIFTTYIVLLGLIFILCNYIFNFSLHNNRNSLFALLAVGFYGIHAANAETINYIIMRSDSFSTLCIVASLLLYIHPKTRKYYLYLLVIIIGILTKETGVMAGPLLFFYVLFFEEKISLTDLVTLRKLTSIFVTLKKSFPALLVSFGSFILIQKFMFPPGDPGSGGSSVVWQYFYTQWLVIIHYIGNFILPLNLSVDTDFVLLESVLDQKVLLSLAVILSLVTIAFISSEKKETRPIAFGIMWFFIALAPTSSFFPFGQISNDHRTFFPYIGLIISLGWWLRLLYLRNEENLSRHTYLNKIFIALYFAVISLHGYGTYQRNKVWSSSETLWRDAVIKSPNNGRVQMNYGLNLMQKGDYEGTLPYFQKALQLTPHWAYIHINMGILREAMGFHEEAEQYFQKAIRYQPFVPDGYYFYARWLHGKNRIDEAIVQLKKGQEISPGHTNINEYLTNLSGQKTETPEENIKKLKKLSEENPSAENFIELSLAYYRNGMFQECITACENALKIQPDMAIAYNNICSANNAMKQWEKAAEACTRAIEIDSTFQRAKNNLKWAEENMK